jgi:periplasmic iron binding protein
MSRSHQMVIAFFAVSLCIAPAAAKEFYVGEPVVKNEVQIVPHYLLGIEMSAMPKGTDMSHDAVHLEVDVHATKDEKHGLADGEWVPYLTITYTIEATTS